jgi:hypothetical protein
MAASAHHGSGANCQKLPDSAEVQPRGVSDHDCGSHAGALPEIATVAAVRADWGCVPAPLAIGIAYSSVKTLSSFEPALTHRPSHVTALLTSTPLVLRV